MDGPTKKRRGERDSTPEKNNRADNQSAAGQRRKRLSRKEQKERKKRKKLDFAERSVASSLLSSPPTTTPAKDASTEPATDATKPRKSKQKKIKKKKEQNQPKLEASIVEHDKSDHANTNIESSYVPISIPTIHELEKTHGHDDHKSKSLGKWFPKAVVLKSREPPITNTHASLVLFYQYVQPLWPESVTQQLMAYLVKIAKERCLGGRIRVAREGVNATLSSRDCSDSIAAATTLRHFAKDLQSFHPVFCKTDFKFIDNLSGDRHFKDLKVLPVKELVFYGFDEAQAPLEKTGVHLSAEAFHEKLNDKEAVVIDVRNSYEAAIGRFDGQTVSSTAGDNDDDTEEKPGGASYIDPKMRKSTDFKDWLQKPETQSQLQGKNVLLYCTGGVRCERASAHLNHSMGDQVQGVYQLQGGIERYLQAFPDGGHWRGSNFVFDKREAFRVDNPNGEGGVVDRTNATTSLLPEMRCCVCHAPWERYVGKKKCQTCGVPVLMCDTCMTSTKDGNNEKTGGKQQKRSQDSLLIRCPLCVEENVTIRAKDVDWTDNGVTTVRATSAKDPKNESKGKHQTKKAASSVLKWGGGYAAEKKERRRFKRKLCRYGAECKRSECFFAHPADEHKASSVDADNSTNKS